MLPPSLMTTPLRKAYNLLIPVRWSRRLTAALVALGTLAALGACGVFGGQTVVRTIATLNPSHGTLYFLTSASGGTPPMINALDANDGSVRWQRTIGGFRAPLVFNGATLFLSTEQTNSGSTLTAVTAATGATAWHHDFTQQNAWPFAATADTVFVTRVAISTGGPITASIAALHASDGTLAWNTDLPELPEGSEGFDGTALYVITSDFKSVTSANYTLMALSAGDGKSLWSQGLASVPASNSDHAALTISDGVLYLTERSRTTPGPGVLPSTIIEAEKDSDGTRLWQTTTPASIEVDNLVAGADGVFYTYTTYSSLGAVGGGLVALNASDGTVAWQHPLTSAEPLPELFTVESAAVYAQVATDVTPASPTYALRAYDARTGTIMYERTYPKLALRIVPRSSVAGPIVGGVLYLMAYGERLGTTPNNQALCVVLALRTSDGTAEWAYTLDGAPTSGLLYAAP